MDQYLTKQPAPEERIEFAIAALSALYFNRTRGESEAGKRVRDYLPFLDPWPKSEIYSELDLEIMRALGK